MSAHPTDTMLRDADAELDHGARIAELFEEFLAARVKLALVDGPSLRAIYEDYEPDFWSQLGRLFANLDSSHNEISNDAIRTAAHNMRNDFACAARIQYADRAADQAREKVR